MKKISFIQLAVVAILTFSCSDNQISSRVNTDEVEQTEAKAVPVINAFTTTNNKLSDYWYKGTAEISSYTLDQNRYNDVHPGQAVLIFVTEDFLTDKMVKNDHYKNPNSAPILKTNMIRKFPTGIYDYSMMTSVFTPVNSDKHVQTFKISSSSQEWCGHTYMQVVQTGKGYDMNLHSYFENEADQEKHIEAAVFEDEMFNRIRINPASLPTGRFKMYMSLVDSRLMHKEFKPYQVDATLTDYNGSDFQGQHLKSYKLVYSELKRTVEIFYSSDAPYVIEGWKETYPGFDGNERTTTATRRKTIQRAYWQEHDLKDMELKKLLE